MNEQQILMFRCRIEASITEREAMIALNTDRANKGLAQAYTEESFMSIAHQFNLLDEQLRGM